MSVRLAIKTARLSKYKHRIGAVVSKGQRILSTAFNAVRYKQGRFKKKWINSLHAEQAALLQVSPKKLKGARLTVVRLMKDGSLGNACPCQFCRDMIFNYKLKEVVYSNMNGDIVVWKLNE